MRCRLRALPQPVPAYEVVFFLLRLEKPRAIEVLRATLDRPGTRVGATHRCFRCRAGRTGSDRHRYRGGRRGQIAPDRRTHGSRPPYVLPWPGRPWASCGWRGRCLDVGMTVSYWPFLDVLLHLHLTWPRGRRVPPRGVDISAALESLAAQGRCTLRLGATKCCPYWATCWPLRGGEATGTTGFAPCGPSRSKAP